MNVAVFLLGILLTLLCIHIVNIYLYWRRKNVKCLVGESIFGNFNLLFLRISIGSFLDKIYKETKENLVGFYIMSTPCLLIKDINLVKHVLIKDFQYFVDRPVVSDKELDIIGGQMLFLMKNPEWKYLRNNLAISFSTGKLKLMFPKMMKIGNHFADFLRRHQNKPTDTKEMCGKYSTDVISSCAFGLDANCFDDDNAISRVAARKIFKFNLSRGIQFTCYFLSPLLTKLFKMKFLDPESCDFVKKMFDDILKSRQNIMEKPNDFVGLLSKLVDIEKGNAPKCSVDAVVAQAAQFFVAGFETVGSTILFTFYELAKNPEIQDRLRSDIKKVMEENKELTYDVVSNLPYLEMVVKETLRKYPVLPFLDRMTGAKYKVPGTDIVLDKGTSVYISLMGLHYDPEYFPEPTKYNPERFSKENIESIEKFSYIPFGDGPRNCIGARFGYLSAKVGVFSIVSNFKIRSCKDYGEEIKLDPKGFLLSPFEQLQLMFESLDVLS